MTSDNTPSEPSATPPRPSGPPTAGIPVVPPPAPPQGQAPTRTTPAFLSRIPGAAWAVSAGAGVAAYLLSALLGSLTWAAIIGALAGFSDSSDVDPVGVSDFLEQDGAPSAASIAILFAATAWLGPIVLDGSFALFSADASFGGSLFFPLLSVTAIVAVGLFWAGRWAEGRWGSGGPLGRAAVSLVTGLVTMLFVIFMPLILAIRVREDDASITMHGVSFAGAISALLIGSLFTFWGRTSQARRAGEAPALGRVGVVLREYGAAASLVAVHAAVLGAILYISLVLAAAFSGEAGAAGALLLLPLNVAVWAFTLGTFGGFSARASFAGVPLAGEGGVAEQGWIFSSVFLDGGALAISLILFFAGLLVLPLLAIRWLVSRHREPRHLGTLGWLPLPLTYLAASLFLLWWARVSATATGAGVEVGAVLGPAGWGVAVLLGVGLLVEVMARFVAPTLVATLPGGLVRWIGGRGVAYAAPPSGQGTAAPAPQTTPAASPAAAASPQATAPSSQPASPPPAATPAAAAPSAAAPGPSAPQAVPLTTREPLSPAARKRTFRIVAAALVVGIVIASGAITTAIVNRTMFGPAGVVEDYLAALRDGNATAAEALAPVEATSDQRAALSDEVFAAAGLRITDFDVTDTSRDGDTAVVTASVTQDEKASDIEFALTRGENRSGIFHGWQLENPAALWATVQVPTDVETLLINGVEVPAAGSTEAPENAFGQASEELKTVELAMLPGLYTVSVPPLSKYEGFGEDQTLGFRLDSPDPNEGAGLVFEAGYTQQLVDDVRAELAANLDQCIAATSFQPSGCPNNSYVSGDGDNYRDPSWQLVAEPIYSLDIGYEGGVYAYAEEPGLARLSYEYDEGWFDETDWVRRSDDVSLDASYDVIIDGESFDLRLQDPF